MSNQNETGMNDVPQMGQEAITVSAEMLLAQIVGAIGEEFVVIPTHGWMAIVQTLQEWQNSEHDEDDDLLEKLENLGVPVIPVSLTSKEEEKRILTPDDIRGDSRIIIP
jgi:hypothetical protein